MLTPEIVSFSYLQFLRQEILTLASATRYFIPLTTNVAIETKISK